MEEFTPYLQQNLTQGTTTYIPQQDVDFQKVKDVLTHKKNDFIHTKWIHNYYMNYCKKYNDFMLQDVFFNIMMKTILENQKN